MINQKLSILIILYEEELETIIKCLEKIRDFRIIIIDNANNRSLKNEIIKKFKIYKYFLNKKNIGFSKAANQGIKECDTEYLFILGPRTAVILFLVISIFSILFFLPTRYCWC